ncbi:pickpocket protein 28-like [Topomyia yanbarensis]|uniref:pickpocket protein 28-like n=1 Tax=Topomyia yanbarensis TaxID=2498891 RepID=UPI00273B94CA|nr:pickpocket protein 28-like [Topomyia yanbarensis]
MQRQSFNTALCRHKAVSCCPDTNMSPCSQKATRTPSNPLNEKIRLHSKKIAVEFCDGTPIHGIKHLIGKDKLLVERIWWITFFVLSLYFCFNYIHSVYERWLIDPIIVSFDHQAASIYTIPFPAVTICPETKVKASELNVSHTFMLVRNGELNETIDKERVQKLMALLQLCDLDLYDRSKKTFNDTDMLSLLRNMSIPSFEVFSACYWKGRQRECLDLFKTSLTDKGFCYTFNSLANNDILRKEELDPKYAFNSETRASDWSLDAGYTVGAGSHSFPHRTITGGYHGGLAVTLLVNTSDVDYFCGNSFQGFKVFLHMPNEYPQPYHFFRIPMDHELIVTVNPYVMAIERQAQQYPADIRKCYSTNERYLRFFKIYTKQNCEIECLTNYTFNMCGCVRFSMPRPPGVPICSLRDNPCYRKALVSVQKIEAKAVDESEDTPEGYCNCLPTCNDIEYQTQVSQAHWEWERNVLEKQSPSASVHQSKIVIHFKQPNFIPLKRSEINGLSDMIANCGGLLGLFMGASILSVVEMFYYCTLRPYAIWRLSKQEAVSGEESM